MHPLVARIHPALRTALTAWLLSRVVIWSAAPGPSPQLAGGPPLPGMVATFIDGATAAAPAGVVTELVAAAPWLVLEGLLLAAGVAVYRFVRTTELPQFAERACWLWFFNPVLAISAGDWGAQMAAACGALAIASIATHRPRRAIVAAVVATGCRLEFIILWPAMALAAWHHRRDERHTSATLAGSMAAIPVAFTAWIATTLHLAGSANTSIRSMHGGGVWRDSLASSAPPAAEWMALVAAAVAIAVSLHYVRRFPAWYTFAALPALAWPLFRIPATMAAVSICWALPLFAYLAVATDDRCIERPLLAALAVAFVAGAFAP